MERIVRQMIADSMELAIPVLTPRRGALPELPDTAYSTCLVFLHAC